MSMWIVSVLLIIAAIIILFSGERSISGFSVTSIMSAKINYWFAVIVLILGFVLLLAERRIEEKVKYDSCVKSFRRTLEKTDHRKVGYEEAEKLYKEARKKYWDSVGKAYVKHHYDKPLELLEQYAKPQEKELLQEQKKLNVNVEYIHDKTLLRLAKEATNNMLVERDVEHVLEELKKGNEQPGLTTKYIGGTEGIIEYRTRRGARVYAKRDGNNVNIVGISSKGNQDNVIEKLKEKFPRK